MVLKCEEKNQNFVVKTLSIMLDYVCSLDLSWVYGFKLQADHNKMYVCSMPSA